MLSNHTHSSTCRFIHRFQLVASFLLCLVFLNACGGGAGTVGIATGTALYTTAPSTLTIPIASNNYTVGGGTGPYKSSSSNTNVATTTLQGSALSIVGIAGGTAQISVTDATGATVTISVTVGSGTSSIPLYTTAPGPITLALGMSSTFTIGGGKPSYLISSSNSAVVATGINGNSFIVSGVSAGSAQIAVFDSTGDAVSISVTVGAGGSGQELFVSAPSAITSAINEISNFNIGGGTAPYTVTSSNARVITTSVTGNALKITGIAKGSAQALVFDAKGASVTIAVTVDPNNASIPLFTAAPSAITMTPGITSFYSIAGGVAAYSATSSNTSVARASVSGTSLSISSFAAGSAQILVFDATGASVSISLTVTTAGGGVSLFTAAPSTVSLALGAASTFTVGGGTAPYTATSSNASIATASMAGNTLSINGLISGSAQILVFDAVGASVSITATVGSGGTTATFYTAAPSAVTTTIGVTSNYAIGGGTAPYTVTSSNIGVASALVTGTNLRVSSVGIGSAQILVFDATGASITIGFTVLTAGNGIPLFTAAPAIVTMGVGITNSFTIGGGTAPYTVSTSNTNTASASVVLDRLNVNALANGTAQILVFDATGSSVAITVNVSSGGSSLAFFTAAPSSVSMAVGATAQYQVGGGSTPYAVTTSNAGIARGDISGNTLTISGISTGSAQILVFDATGVSTTISVTISSNTNNTALFTTAPSNLTMAAGLNNTYTISGGTAPYTVTSSNASVATANNSPIGTTLTIHSVAAGSAQVLVFDATGTSISITVVVNSGGATTALFTTAASTINMSIGAAGIYTIGGGTAPYTASTNNAGVATAVVSGTSLVINSLTSGTAQILVFDAVGTSISLQVSITQTGTALIDIQPNTASGNVGDVLNYIVSGGVAPYTISVSNVSVALAGTTTVAASGDSFSMTLRNVGTTDITVRDALGQTRATTLTVLQLTTQVRISPSALIIGEDNVSSISLNIYGGSGVYQAFTSDLTLTSVTTNGSILTIGLGSSTNRCINPVDSSGTRIIGGSHVITITIVDSTGASATTLLTIQDNYVGSGVVTTQPSPFVAPCT